MKILEVAGLSKSYPLSTSQWARLKHAFAPAAARSDQGIHALRDVSFTVERGEAFGIIGANGSGKSTLLQIVAGILQPSAGSVEVNGRLSALLELGSGFSPEFTGRQNVYLNGSILGLSESEINQRFDTIERFANIGDFIDRPIRTYSTGMVLRLAFAVVAHVDPEILIVDEALAVGDIAFRQRCMRRIHDLRAAGTTILFVSHDTGDVKALCERCLWLENGRIRALGPADSVIAEYLSAMMQRERARDTEDRRAIPAPAGPPQIAGEVITELHGIHRYGDGHATVCGADLTTDRWLAGAAVMLRVSFRVIEPISAPIAGFLVRNEKGETIFGSNTTRENYPLPAMQPGEVRTVHFHWVLPELTAGRYSISVAVSDGELGDFRVCDYVEDAITIEAPATGRNNRGYIRLHCSSVSVHRTS